MDSHPLGESHLKVTPIGLGLAALGRPGYINLGHDDDLGGNKSAEALEVQAHEVLDAAWDAGVRYFDVARSYGRAEEFLGSWLEIGEIGSSEVSVGSKWGYTYTADWQTQAKAHEVKDHSIKTLRRQYKESRGFLGEHLQLYQVHSATEESGVLGNFEVLDELARLKSDGLLIGLTLSGPQQTQTLERAMGIERDGLLLFDAVQATWNLLEPSAGSALMAAHNAGMGVIVKEALANGRLTQRNEAPDFAQKRTLLRQMADQLDATIDALAIAAILVQPWADVVLSGAAKMEHLSSNLRALELDLGNYDQEIMEALAESPKEYWQIRGELLWN